MYYDIIIFVTNKIILPYAKSAIFVKFYLFILLKTSLARIQLEYNTGTVLPMKKISDYCLLFSTEI